MKKNITPTPKSWGNNSVPLKQTTLLCTLMFFSVEDILNISWKFHSWKIKSKRKKLKKTKKMLNKNNKNQNVHTIVYPDILIKYIIKYPDKNVLN